jgi:hypothetical protein
METRGRVIVKPSTNTGLRNLPHILFPFLVTCIALFCQPALAQQIKSPLPQDLSRAYVYYSTQKLGIEKIKKDYPVLVAEAMKAQAEFDIVFGSSYKNIKKELQRMLGQRWTEYENKMQRQILNSLGSYSVSAAQAAALIREVRLRATGQIESPVLETLLTYNPEFQRNPAEEFLRGFTKTYRTKGHPKAKGIDFQIQYPKSWRAKEGKRPNVIQLIISENGRGLDGIVLMVRDLPLPPGYSMTEQDLNDLFSQRSLKEMVPNGASLVTAKTVVLDNHKGGMIVFDQTHQRIDVKVSVRSVQFITVYGNKMIFVQFMTRPPPGGSHLDLNDRFRKVELLFKLVANSFVIQSQY